MRNLCLLICLLVSVIKVSSQHRRLDSLKQVAANCDWTDTTKVNAFSALSLEYQWKDYTTSLAYADSALTLSEKLNFTRGIATAYNLKGFCYWALGDNDLAIAAGLDALKLAERELPSHIRAECYLVLARAYMDQNERVKARNFLNQARQIAEKNESWDQLSRALNLEGVIQFVSQQKDSALLSYKAALKTAQMHGIERINYTRIISNIAECYLPRDPKTAFSYFDEALSIAKETGNNTAEASISGILGQALLKNGDLRKAEDYLQASLKLARSIGLRRTIRHSYSGLVELRMKQGRPEEAIDYLRRYYDVRDSLLNTAKTRQIVQLEAKHELEKKEQEIRLLEKEKEIQNIQQNILIGVLVLIAALSLLAYYLQRYREKKNRQILDLEIDYLTRQHKEVLDKYKSSLLGAEEATIESQDQRLLKKAISTVEANIADPLFGVEKMAKEMGMSRTNMHRKISSITGFSPSELIRTIRLRKAATMLVNQVDSVSQISIAVGFEDHSYFSKAFKKQFGVPPSEYAQSTALEQEVIRQDQN